MNTITRDEDVVFLSNANARDSTARCAARDSTARCAARDSTARCAARRSRRNAVDVLYYLKETVRGAAHNRRLLLMWGLFLAGMLAGARLCRISDGFFHEQCDTFFASWLELNASRSFGAMLRSSLLTNAVFAIAAMLMGISAAGLPLIGCLPLLRGLGLGVLCGKLYGEYALRGLGGSLLMIVPGAVVTTFGLLLMCKENMDSAQAFSSAAKNKSFPDDWRGLREHLTRCAALLLFVVAGALLDATATAIFGAFTL